MKFTFKICSNLLKKLNHRFFHNNHKNTLGYKHVCFCECVSCGFGRSSFVYFVGLFSDLRRSSRQLRISCGHQVSLEGRKFPVNCTRGEKPQLHVVLVSLLFLSAPFSLLPSTNPLTPDSENRWRGKWGFGAEEFTVSRETFTSIWVAQSTLWNPIVTF